MVQSVTDELSLMDYVAVVRRRWLLIVSCALLLALIGFGWSSRQTKQYQGKAEVLVDFSSSTQYVQPNGGSNQAIGATDRTRALQNEIRFAKSQVVLDPLDQKLGHKADLAVSGQTSTADVLTFTAKSTTPAQAAAEANAFAQAYVAARSERVVNSYADVAKVIDNVLTDLRNRLAALAAPTAAGTDPDASQRQSLESQIKIYEGQKTALDASAKVGQGSGATIITRAETPTSPVSPKPLRTGVLALAVGLVLGIGLAFLREFLDDTIRTTDDLERSTNGVPVLGAIPKDRAHAMARPDPGHDLTGRLEEAFRSLRTSVQFIGLHRPLHSLQVTSANATEGKTTVASHLAAALVYGGEHVVLIDGDLRNPSLHTRFGLPNDMGLSTVMLGQIPLSDALLRVDGMPGLLVLPAGPLPGNPADFLWPSAAPLESGCTLPDLIRQLTEDGYRVIVDCPPVLPVADAMTISRMVEGTIVVVASGSTGSRSLTHALQQLAQAEAAVVGMAFNSVTGTAAYGAYGYGYGYGARPTGLLARLRARFTRRGRRQAQAAVMTRGVVWPGRVLGAQPFRLDGPVAGSPGAPRVAPPQAKLPTRTPSGDAVQAPGPNGQGGSQQIGAAGAAGPSLYRPPAGPVPSNGRPVGANGAAVPNHRSVEGTHAPTTANGVQLRPLTGSAPRPAPGPTAQHPPPGQHNLIDPARLSRATPPAPGTPGPKVNGRVQPPLNGTNGMAGTAPAAEWAHANGSEDDAAELEQQLRRHLGVDPTTEGKPPIG